MKKLKLLAPASLFFILTAFTCERNLEAVNPEQEAPDPVCETEGELRKNQRGIMDWSESVKNWVLKVDFENKGNFEGAHLLTECNGFPEELQHRGIEIICDIEMKKHSKPGVIKLAAHAIELKKYEIVSIPPDK